MIQAEKQSRLGRVGVSRDDPFLVAGFPDEIVLSVSLLVALKGTKSRVDLETRRVFIRSSENSGIASCEASCEASCKAS